MLPSFRRLEAVGHSLVVLLGFLGPVFFVRTGAEASGLAVAESSALAYVTGSLNLSQVIAGEPAYFEVAVANGGGSDAVLDAATTLSFGSAETRLYVAPLLATATVPAGGQAVLRFQSTATTADFPPGAVAPVVNATGQDGDGGLTQSLAVSDSLIILAPQAGLVEVAGTLQPTDPSRRSMIVFWVRLQNTTACPIELGAGSEVTLRDGQRWWQRYPLLQGVTVPPGGVARVEFTTPLINGHLTGIIRDETPDGVYAPLFRLFGAWACDGTPFSAVIDSAQTTTVSPVSGELSGIAAYPNLFDSLTQAGGVVQLNGSPSGSDPHQILMSAEVSEVTACPSASRPCNLLRLDQVVLESTYSYGRTPGGDQTTGRLGTAYVHVLATADMVSDLPWYIRAVMYRQSRPANCTGGCVGVRLGVVMNFYVTIAARTGQLTLGSVAAESTFVRRGEPFLVAVGARNANSGDPNAPLVPLAAGRLLLNAAGADVGSAFDQTVANAGIAIHQENERPILFRVTAQDDAPAGRVLLGANVASEGVYSFYLGKYDTPTLSLPYDGPRTVTIANTAATDPAAGFVYVVDALPLSVLESPTMIGTLSRRLPLTVANAGPWELTIDPGSSVEVSALPRSPLVLDTAGNQFVTGMDYPAKEWAQSVTAPQTFSLRDFDFALYDYSLPSLPADVPYTVEVVPANADGSLPTGVDGEVAPADNLARAGGLIPAGSLFQGRRLPVTTPPLDVRLEQGRRYFIILRFGSPVVLHKLYTADYADGESYRRDLRLGVMIWKLGDRDLHLKLNARNLIFQAATTLDAPLTLAAGQSAVVPFAFAEPFTGAAAGLLTPALTLRGAAAGGGDGFAYHQRVAAAGPFVRLVETPVITGFSPAFGPVGASVTIYGVNLSAVTAVAFNGTPVTSFTRVSDFEIVTVVPDGATTGDVGVSGPHGAVSSTTNFVVPYPPTTPTNPSPAYESDDVLPDAVLAWSSGDLNGDPLVYEVRFGTTSPPPVVVAGQSEATYDPPGQLAPHTVYYWQIVAADGQGGVTAGPIWRFTTLNRPPVMPSDPSPADGATGRPLGLTLSWSSGEPDGDLVFYLVRFGAASPLPLVAVLSETTYDAIGPLDAHTTYYWQIVAQDEFGAKTEGPVWAFTTLNRPPAAPSSPSPAGGAIGVPVDVAPVWVGRDPDGDPLSYEVRFGTTNPPPLQVGGQGETSFDPPGELAHSTTYYWQIIADDGHDRMPGPVWSFTTVAPPPIYLSLAGAGTLSNQTYTAGDILSYLKDSNSWNVFFDASSVAISKNLGAFAFQSGDILLGFSVAQVVPGLGTTKVAPQDLVRFTPTRTGYHNTAGTFTWFFDGSDVGLTTSGEIIDALWIDVGGRLYISTAGSGSVPVNSALLAGAKIAFQDEDVLRFTPDSTGATTAGTWELYWNPTSITGMPAEDINGYWEDPVTGQRYVTIAGAFNVGNAAYGGKFAGNGSSILRFAPNAAAPGGWAPAEKLMWLAVGATLPAKFAIDGIEMAR